MEEDTELRDLVVQTLENNGVLAKIRVRPEKTMSRKKEKYASLCRLGMFLGRVGENDRINS